MSAVRDDLEVNLHLSNGHIIETELEKFDLEDSQEVLEDLKAELDHRPGWQVIGDVLCFTGAVSAISLR